MKPVRLVEDPLGFDKCLERSEVARDDRADDEAVGTAAAGPIMFVKIGWSAVGPIDAVRLELPPAIPGCSDQVVGAAAGRDDPQQFPLDRDVVTPHIKRGTALEGREKGKSDKETNHSLPLTWGGTARPSLTAGSRNRIGRAFVPRAMALRLQND